ncbi:MAG: hypothetical protein HY300_17785 [Verrucomicrobia bacterium]|nr:hypothetical protein [Verrucomicrobiota bacterium]
MKNSRLVSFASLIFALALGFTARAADVSVKLSGVHLCCNSCVKGVDKAIAKVSGASAQSDKDAGTVAITAPDQSTAQKAVDALVAAGYFGASSDASVKITAHTGAKDAKVQSLTVTGVHLCCGKCATAVQKAVSGVDGVKGNTAEKNVPSFEVTGDFNAKAVFTALQNAGLTGKAGK